MVSLAYRRRRRGRRGRGSRRRRRRGLGYRTRRGYRRRMRRLMPYRRFGGAASFSHVKYLKHKYCTEITLSVNTSFDVQYADFRGNGMYDPDAGVGGHQPLGFDQWVPVYANYVVLCCKCIMTPICISAGDVAPCYYGVYNARSTGYIAGAASAVDNILENPAIGPIYTAGAFEKSVGKNRGITKWCWPHKVFGVPFRALETNPNFWGTGTSDPLQTAFIECFATNVAGNDPGSCDFRITLVYYAKWFARIWSPES